MRRDGLLWIAAIIVVYGCSESEGPKAPSREQPAGRTAAVGTVGSDANGKTDRDFVRDVATMNMAEIELSRLALDKATTPEIKVFAQQLIDEHGAAASKLQSVVSGQPIEWPSQLDEKHTKIANELGKEQGVNFDRDYAKAIVYGHQDLAAKLESRLDLQSLADWKTAAAGRTQTQALPEPGVALRDVKIRPLNSANELTTKINQWAAETYPVTQKHLDTARTLRIATKAK